MNVHELKRMLKKYPDDMEIIVNMHSDFCLIEEDMCEVINGVDKNGWIMTSHLTMSEANKRLAKGYLFIG